MSTGIQWTDETWNPVSGCDRVSAGCDRCYALTMANRLKGMGVRGYQEDGDPRTSGPGFAVQLHPWVLAQPLRWRRPRRIFVDSMGDLFHDDVPDDYISQVFAVMALASQHTFQLLTKRHARMRSLLSNGPFQQTVLHHLMELRKPLRPSPSPGVLYVDRGNLLQVGWPLPNVHLGVSVENQQWADIRIPALLETPAAVRWISAEPLLGPLMLSQPWVDYLNGWRTEADHDPHCDGACRLCPIPVQVQTTRLNWVVTGGESGVGARPAHPDWFQSIRAQCESAGVAYLHKQNGAWRPAASGEAYTTHLRYDGSTTDDRSDGLPMVRVGKHDAGRDLDGITYDDYPC